jgi:hypothetical protein
MGSASARRPDRPERDRSAADPPDRAGFSGGHADRDALAEDFGPLALQRVKKDDGRALILYSRAEPEPEPGSR